MATGIEAQVTSEDERTFQFQDQLASLPVPSLEQTLDKYLDSVKPHVTEEEFREVQSLCQQFASGEGRVLHEKLLARAQTMRNWMEKWWEDVAYLECRLPKPLMNMAGPGPYVYDIWKPQPGSMIFRGGLLLHFMVHFWQLVRKEKIRPHKDGNGKPFCMSQFRKVFNTSNIPGVQKDRLMHHFKTVSEGECPCHIVVMCKGHLFCMDTVDSQGDTLSAPEFQSQLQKIYDKAASMPAAPGVGFFTAGERTEWANVRSRIIALHPQNFQTLECIEKALMVTGLDDHSPADVDELGMLALFGNPMSKWFDKSINLTIYSNGLVTSCCDHSPVDGMMLVTSTYFVHCKLLECGGKWKGPTGVRKLPEPEVLQLHLDSLIHQSLQIAKDNYIELSSRVEGKVSIFDWYGKRFLKSKRVHPDTCIQLSFQLAYYRLYKKHAPTYETATTRKFYLARTETVRACTPEACQWSEEMENMNISDREKLKLFLAAVAKHNRWMEDATNMKGCDRHLFGLGMVAREEGLPIPHLFQHPAFVKSGGGANYILSTSCLGYTSVFGAVAPMCPNGYGIFYCINDDKMHVFVTTWTADEDTCSKTFTLAVHQALRDIRQLLENAESSVARL